MRYTPYSEAQIQSMNIMDEGVYPFQVLDVITTDKLNNPMTDRNGVDIAKLKLLVWDNENKERTIFTYISGDGNFAYKLRHFAKTVGMLDDYEQGIFNIHATLGKSGMADIVIKKGTIKSDGSGEMWPDRNDVKDYVYITQGEPKEAPPLEVNQSKELDDDIPFSLAPDAQVPK